MINKVKNIDVVTDQAERVGIVRISAISKSKIMNRIINRKNRSESGLRGVLVQIPEIPRDVR